MNIYLPRKWHRYGLMLGVFLALITALARAGNQWYCATTEHFEVFTNARQSDAKVLVARLEQFRDSFLGILPGKSFREPRTTVVIFASDREFRAYRPLYKGKPIEAAGLFQGNSDEVVIALTTERELEQTIPTIYHEYIHLLMHARGYRLPPWLNEGVAELYETMEFEDESVRVGRHNPHHVMLLNRTSLMPLAKLFAVTHRSPEYNEGQRRGLFYAQSWALLHYCQTVERKGKRLGEGFGELINLMSMGFPPEKCMQTAYGISLEEMQEQLESHVSGGRYVLKNYRAPKVDYKARVNFRAASDFERDIALANLKWRFLQNGDATYHVLQLAEKNPGAARPLEVLAAIAHADGERKRGIDYWTEAAKRGSTNPYVYGQLAKDSLRQYLNGAKPDFRLSAEACEELRGWLDRALALEPNYAEAWDWLALTEAFSPKPRAKVVNELQKQKDIWGNRPRLLAGFAVIALRINNPEFAEHLADALLEMPLVTKRPNDMGALESAASSINGGRTRSWTERPEFYPDVAAIARSIKRQIERSKPGATETRDTERVIIEFAD